MNKSLWWIAGIIFLLACAGVFASTYYSDHKTSQTVPISSSGNGTVGASGASSVITYTDTGFTPSPLTIAAGTTVTWSNESSGALWIESASSTSADCAQKGITSLNECASISENGSYSHTFTTAGTFIYTNKDKSSDTGTIIVSSDSVPAGKINPTSLPE